METISEQRTLWRHSNFLRLWTSETISQFGSQFTALALPLTAIIYLQADPTALGVLAFAGSVPWLLFGLIVGVWVDRHRKQRIMVTSNILRGSLLALIPVAAIFGLMTRLGLPFLYLLSFFIGFLQVFFDVSYQSYLPALVKREQLVEGNSKLEGSRSTAQVVGPTIAGIVIKILTAPIAIIFDACSFFASALTIGRIEHDEEIKGQVQRPSIRSDVSEGLSVVLKDQRLRSIAGSTGTSNFFSSAMGAILLLYFAYPSPAGLGVPESLVGLVAGIIFSVGSIGALVGVVLASPLAKRVGLGPVIVGSALISGLGVFPFYFAGPATVSPILTIEGLGINSSVLFMMLGQFITLIGVVVYNINQVSLRQAIVPIRLQGRMNASMRFIVWGTIPLGGLAGGLLGAFLGLRTAIGISAVGGSAAFLWVLFSPVRSLRNVPEPLA